MLDVTRVDSINLVDLIGRDTTIKKVSAREWAGPCPKCGGRDRLRVNLDKGWFCRQCNDGHWNDAIDYIQWRDNTNFKTAYLKLFGNSHISSEDMRRIAAERELREKEQADQELKDREKAIEYLNTKKEWLDYAHHPMAIEKWAERGVNKTWVDFYDLGYCQSRTYGQGDESITTDSLTIPYLRYDNDQQKTSIIDLKHRLITDTSKGKYRHHVSNCGNNIFLADPFQVRLFGDLLILEGEIKAIVTWKSCWIDGECMLPLLNIVGIPGKSDREQFNTENVERIFVCLDPDANKESERLAEELNGVSVKLPGKIDDLLLAGVINCFDLMRILEDAWHLKTR